MNNIYSKRFTIMTAIVVCCISTVAFVIYELSELIRLTNLDEPLIGVAFFFAAWYAIQFAAVSLLISWSVVLLLQGSIAFLKKKEIAGVGKAHYLVALLLIASVSLLYGSTVADFIKTVVPVKVIENEGFTNSMGMEMVKLNADYYVSRYETTQEQFEKLMGCNPSHFVGPALPVESVTSAQARTFCEKATELDRQKGKLPKGYSYALPTFDQWQQYVADAALDGSVTPAGSKQYLNSTRPVGSGTVNRLGLYDLRGNVAEISHDGQISFGASWNTARKDFLHPLNQNNFSGDNSETGFRCVLVK
ncbi:Formylglycine-generating sulfatase enzyme [Anaerohalosphaera lusitana]|uniref:Formylglycine-generating sulfatase enzyme n=1 Tax=Anaerohalosphaera lusitana TaxID=1936003 RepID=A0A1U9NIT5_9BACT|nr:SUMF1/EgtB/PvdO family nonheme iron enzyme [Anaerohalosphaera lusitana]AQT67839.1 Formylglycine-generating sulfatase enzyme [Anaerohalosphaera lusitana]